MEVLKNFEEAGQAHVFSFYPKLSPDEQKKLVANLSAIDISRSVGIFKKAMATPAVSAQHQIDPLPNDAYDSVLTASPDKIKNWYDTGLKAITEGKVAVILLAGGQGTRLGSSDPKGCYDIGLLSHKSLFQIQAERIKRLQDLAREVYQAPVPVIIPWYIMTSGPTRKATEDFFKKNSFFGLDPQNVVFFEQGVLPAFTFEGKIILEDKDTPSVAPDGNGGIYAALRSQGIIEDLSKRGIPYVHAYCVDNCLVKVADPTFLGFCIQQNVECGAKAVQKRDANEPVGIICMKDKRYGVVEYSEIDSSLASLKDDKGNLVYRAANIANHFYTTEFLRRIETFEKDLEYHIAKKKIKHVDLETGEKVSPTSPNGIKLELFIFDVFPFTNKFAVLETDRKEEFSPLKNAPGSKDGDSPETSRKDIMTQCIRFARDAGAIVSTEELEISPLVSYAGEGLEALKGVTISQPTLISSKSDLDKLVKE